MEIRFNYFNRFTSRVVFPILVILTGLVGCSNVGKVYFRISTPNIPPAPCQLEELLLDETALPNDEWVILGTPSSRSAPSRIGIERIGLSYSTSSYEGANQDVYRLENDRSAKYTYKDLLSWFDTNDDETEWVTPLEMENISIAPDRYRIGCSTRIPSNIERCQFIAQYGPYVVRLWVVRRLISYEEIVDLVREVDLRMTSCLEGSTEKN